MMLLCRQQLWLSCIVAAATLTASNAFMPEKYDLFHPPETADVVDLYFHRAMQTVGTSSNSSEEVDLEACYNALFIADGGTSYSKDRRIDMDEFVAFVRVLGPPNFLSQVDSFLELPLILRSSFIILACLCLEDPDNTDDQCCIGENAHLSNLGTFPGETPTQAQADYLYPICFLTENSIEQVLKSMSPTSAPVIPTDAPTDFPTDSPVTIRVTSSPSSYPTSKPTVRPTSKPTSKPTVAPTSKPTSRPTPVPTSTPSSTPTRGPTRKPTPGPSPSPTLAPTPQISGVPTESPTKAPTNSPTHAPTRQPTKGPTSIPTRAPTNLPTRNPTSSPTVHPTSLPTDRPTKAPTPVPTTPPTKAPTRAPNLDPTTYPSSQPTGFPTVVPTQGPTEGPTLLPSPQPVTQLPSSSPTGTAPPSSSPTGVPSLDPTATLPPSELPTSHPSASPTTTNPPTGPPTNAPSPSPIDPVPDAVVTTTYRISVLNDATAQSYFEDLVLSMNVLANDVAGSLDVSGGRALRRLAVSVLGNSEIDGVDPVDCPSFVDTSISRCEDITASIGLQLTDGEDATSTSDAFTTDLETAIDAQKLQTALDTINPNSPVQIISGLGSSDGPDSFVTDDTPPEEGGRVTAGGVVGLIAAGVVVAVALIMLLARGSRENPDAYLKQNESVDVAEIDSPSAAGDADDSLQPQVYVDTPSSHGTTTYYDPSQTTPIRGSKQQSGSKIYQVPAAMAAAHAANTADGRNDDSSNAGSSGWSSQGGMSSLDTSSNDDDHHRDNSHGRTRGGATLAEIGAGSALASASQDSEPSLQLTYSELDQAIQKGDWAAVGVTAALLASQSYDTNAGSETDHRVNLSHTLNPSRAAELDRLVEAGDWEGVVAAAAKYDAQEASHLGSVSSRGGSSSRASGGGSVGSSGSTNTGPSAFSSSGTVPTTGGTTASDGNNSRAKKLDEIRAEVAMLVEHVVPEERDNIDEMLAQFSGREEELVETLRSMQERAVAQKARLEGQKRAKRDARQTVEEKYGGPYAVDNTGAPADENWIREIENTPTPDSGNRASSHGLLGIDQLEPPQEADEDKEAIMEAKLREAIENENWDVVAETASGLAGQSFDEHSSGNSTSTSRSDRSQEINALVDRGDWEGVVAAATRYSAVDSPGNRNSVAERRRRREKRLKEEEEALQQADIWDEIAKQTKTEASQSDAGAKVATDWAIARSLSALNRAEDAGKLKESQAQLEVQDEGDEDDNEKDDDDDVEGSV